jgi:hypothetical protein
MGMQAALDLLKTYPEVAIAILSAIVALMSAFVARGETARQRRLQTERLRQGIDVASLDWGAAAIDTLARAAAFTRTKQTQPNELAFEAERADLLINLSTLIDRGRMFFPNIAPDKTAADKEGAYKGKRPPILDALMFPYHELTVLAREGGPPDEESGAFIDDCRRLLVSELQAYLDPRRLDEIVGRYDQRTLQMRKDALERAKALREKLTARHPDAPLDRPAASQTSPEQTV